MDSACASPVEQHGTEQARFEGARRLHASYEERADRLSAIDRLKDEIVELAVVAAIGVVIGLVGAALTTGALRSLLFHVEPTDGLTLSAVAALLLGVTAIASYVPARRAARVDPVETLRS